MSESAGHEKNILILKASREKESRIEKQLFKIGCKVRSVTGGLEAREALCGSLTTNLLIVDIDVGEGELKALVSHVRGRPETAKLPVIALLERDDIGAVARVLGAGCDDFLHKPVSSSVLNMKVRSLLELLPRTSNRVPCRIAVEAGSRGETIAGEIVEIGEEGVGLLLEGLLKKGDVLKLGFALPFSSENIVIRASVVHIRETHGRYLHGVRFTFTDAETKRKIRQYVQEAMLNGEPR